MEMSFRQLVLAKYKVVAGLPDKDYPPANWASAMKNLKAMGKEDLAGEIMGYWNEFLGKYPEYKIKEWKCVINHFNNSIKKHLFNGKAYEEWLSSQHDISPIQRKVAKEASKVEAPRKGTPAVAIPRPNETAEEYHAAYLKTKERLDEVRGSIGNVKDFIAALESESKKLQTKIEKWSGATTKSGSPDERSKRVPSWQNELKLYQDQIALAKGELEKTESKFQEAAKSYEKSPVATEKFETEVQKSLKKILDFIMDIDDLEEQAKMLQKFGVTIDKQKGKGKSEASIRVEADIHSTLSAIVSKLKAAWKSVKSWIKGFDSAVDKFNDLASITY